MKQGGAGRAQALSTNPVSSLTLQITEPFPWL